MVGLAERAIETILNDAVSLFQANLSYFVPDIYTQETSAHQTEITNWWTNANNKVAVQIGYSLSPVKGPQLAITSETGQEAADRRFVGNVIGQSSTTTEYSSTFESVYAVHVFGPNQNWLLWMQAFVRWALLSSRLTLETTYGLINQKVSWSPLRPVPDSLKDTVFPFMRTVFLSCQHEDTWTPLPVDTVQSASLNVNPVYQD